MKKNRYFNIVVGLTPRSNTDITNLSLKNSKSQNVFQCHIPERCKISLFEPNKTYDYVGVKELKSYYERVRKQSKESKRSTINNYVGIPRHSIENKPKEQSPLLNKEQLFSIKSADHSFRTSAGHNFHTTKSSEKQNYPSNLQFQPKTVSMNSTHPFSLQKVKRNLKDYEQIWEKSEKQWQVRKGFPSIMKSISQERLKIEKKESNSFHYLKNHLTTQMWQDSLRDSRDLKKIFSRKKVGTKISKRMLVRGKNKEEVEKDWVSTKDHAGYQFKLIKEEQPTIKN